MSDIQSDKMNETPFCPCCGRPNSIRQSPEWLLTRFSGIFGNLLSLLIERRRERRATNLRDMVAVAYPDGAPVMGHLTVTTTITRDRKRLWELGWDVVGPKTTGDGWYLVPLEPER
ncbi:hypothetical protein RPALISO_20 [Ruegeria phage RpAliso]|nr:hypothetical protein RPALISO_20 [Ruegeria phage RpAliso]